MSYNNTIDQEYYVVEHQQFTWYYDDGVGTVAKPVRVLKSPYNQRTTVNLYSDLGTAKRAAAGLKLNAIYKVRLERVDA